jgi:glycerol dehydrogenase-like iron-containing ADH family enzyme
MTVWPLPRLNFGELNSIQENRPAALLTSAEAWAALNSRLSLPVLIQAEPARYDAELLNYLADNLPSRVKVIYAVGGGAPLAAGKLIAARHQVPLMIIPTALDSTDFLLPTAILDDTIEDRPRRSYPETGPAHEVFIDWEVIQAAPAHLRGAGMVDVISIITGLLDWRFAAQKGKNPREQRFMPWVAGVVTDLAKEAIKNSGAIGQGQPEALRTLLNLMMLIVQTNNQLVHTRAGQGSEHYLAQILGAITGPAASHAELVGPCLLFVSALHGQDPAPLRDALQQAGVRLDQVRATDFNLVVDGLDGHLTDYGFPFSILNELDPQSDAVAAALDVAGLAILADTWKTLEATQPVSAVAQAAVEEAPADELVPALETAAAAGLTPAPDTAASAEAAPPAEAAPVDQPVSDGNG